MSCLMTSKVSSSAEIMSRSSYCRSAKVAAQSLSRKKFRLKLSCRSSAYRTTSGTPGALRLVMVMDRCGGCPSSISLWIVASTNRNEGLPLTNGRWTSCCSPTPSSEIITRICSALSICTSGVGSDTPLLSSVACRLSPRSLAWLLAYSCIVSRCLACKLASPPAYLSLTPSNPLDCADRMTAAIDERHTDSDIASFDLLM
jgi:hypothetical protein